MVAVLVTEKERRSILSWELKVKYILQILMKRRFNSEAKQKDASSNHAQKFAFVSNVHQQNNINSFDKIDALIIRNFKELMYQGNDPTIDYLQPKKFK